MPKKHSIFLSCSIYPFLYLLAYTRLMYILTVCFYYNFTVRWTYNNYWSIRYTHFILIFVLNLSNTLSFSSILSSNPSYISSIFSNESNQHSEHLYPNFDWRSFVDFLFNFIFAIITSVEILHNNNFTEFNIHLNLLHIKFYRKKFFNQFLYIYFYNIIHKYLLNGILVIDSWIPK